MNVYRLTPCPELPVFTGRRSFTARCTGGRVGSEVTREGTATSTVSQAHADALALIEAERIATAALVCRFRAEATSIGSCGFALVVEAFSDVSYEEAHAAAVAMAPAAAEQWCADWMPTEDTFSSTKSYTINCEIPGQIGSHTEERTAYSNISQQAADDAALEAAYQAAFAYVQLYGSCFPAPYVSTQSFTATVECPNGTEGEPQSATVTVTVGSEVSQEAADAAALSQATAAATAQATAALNCGTIGYHGEATVTLTCEEGYEGPSVTRTATSSSTVSQEHADAIALAAAQASAAEALVCTQIVFSAQYTHTAYCGEGLVGASQTATATGTSVVSQAEAYDNAVAAAIAQAESMLFCVESPPPPDVEGAALIDSETDDPLYDSETDEPLEASTE